jgi:hypothetical protein
MTFTATTISYVENRNIGATSRYPPKLDRMTASARQKAAPACGVLPDRPRRLSRYDGLRGRQLSRLLHEKLKRAHLRRQPPSRLFNLSLP